MTINLFSLSVVFMFFIDVRLPDQGLSNRLEIPLIIRCTVMCQQLNRSCPTGWYFFVF